MDKEGGRLATFARHLQSLVKKTTQNARSVKFVAVGIHKLPTGNKEKKKGVLVSVCRQLLRVGRELWKALLPCLPEMREQNSGAILAALRLQLAESRGTTRDVFDCVSAFDASDTMVLGVLMRQLPRALCLDLCAVFERSVFLPWTGFEEMKTFAGHVVLEGCELGNPDVKAVIQPLVTHGNVCELVLKHNPVGAEGVLSFEVGKNSPRLWLWSSKGARRNLNFKQLSLISATPVDSRTYFALKYIAEFNDVQCKGLKNFAPFCKRGIPEKLAQEDPSGALTPVQAAEDRNPHKHLLSLAQGRPAKLIDECGELIVSFQQSDEGGLLGEILSKNNYSREACRALGFVVGSAVAQLQLDLSNNTTCRRKPILDVLSLDLILNVSLGNGLCARLASCTPLSV